MTSLLSPIRIQRALWLFLAIGTVHPTSAQIQLPRFKIAEEDQTHTSPLGPDSSFLSAESVSGANPAVVMGGRFELEVLFPGITPTTLISTPGVPSVFAGVLDYSASDWGVGVSPTRVDKLEPRSFLSTTSPSATLLDLAAVDRSEYYITGIIDDATFFRTRNGTDLFLSTNSTAPPDLGYIASGSDGTFTGAYYTHSTIHPQALATDPGGDLLVIVGEEKLPVGPTGDAKVHAYTLPLPAAGSSLPAPDNLNDPLLNDTELVDVSITSDNKTWVGGTKSGIGKLGGTTDCWIGLANFTTDAISDDLRLGSEGSDKLNKLERGPSGETYVLFSVRGREVSFGTLDYDLDTDPPVTAFLGTHVFLGRINSDGKPEWLVPLGFNSAVGSSLQPADLSIDAAGHAFIAVDGSGTVTIEGVARTFSGGAEIVVSRKGRVIDFVRTVVDSPQAGASPNIENRLVLGATGTGAALSSIESLAVTQTSHTLCLNPEKGDTIDTLTSLVTAAGGQVHLESNFPQYNSLSVSAWLTPSQLRRITAGNPQVKVRSNNLIIGLDSAGFGEVEEPDWALARLFDPFLADVESPQARYFYPSGFVTDDSEAKRVRIYVIDKALNEVENDFDFHNLGEVDIFYNGAEGLDVDAVAGQEATGESNHPRQLVNLMAAVNLGSAQGTALEIINVDMYSGGSTEGDNCLTFAHYCATGILEALSHAEAQEDDLPSIIVIASSGEDALDGGFIGAAVEQALLLDVPVILSAGNDSSDVGTYVPAMFGELDGVITVGATSLGIPNGQNPSLSELNPIYQGSNTDPGETIISLFAPGGNVSTGDYGTASGTSFSCGLVAGLAATFLSLNPNATPDEVEQALVSMSLRDDDQSINLARSVCTFTAWLYHQGLGAAASCPDGGFQDDSDADGSSNLSEFLGGSDPNNPASRPTFQPRIGLEDTFATYSVELPLALVQDDGTLHTGCRTLPVTLQASSDLENWQNVDAQITAGQNLKGRRQLRAVLDVEPIHQGACYLRFVFGPPE